MRRLVFILGPAAGLLACMQPREPATATEEVVYQIVRWEDRLYVATKNGAYLVQENRLVKRYRVEPDIDNRFIIVTESLPPNP